MRILLTGKIGQLVVVFKHAVAGKKSRSYSLMVHRFRHIQCPCRLHVVCGQVQPDIIVNAGAAYYRQYDKLKRIPEMLYFL